MITQENQFTTYEFTESELVEAAKLTTLQRAFIKHQIGILSLEKVNMKLDVSKVVDFAQNEAHITGQIEAYEFLLTADNQSAEIIKELQEKVKFEAQQKVRVPPKPFDLNKQ